MRADDSGTIRSPHDPLLAARVYAFFMLDAAQRKSDTGAGNTVRLIKVALKAAKCSIDAKNFNFAFKVCEKATIYHDQLENCKTDSNVPADDVEAYSQLQAEYYIIRTALAWKQDQLPVADMMYDKAKQHAESFDPETAEKLAGVLYEIGQGFVKKRQHDLATKWLERAYNVLDNQELSSIEAVELRTSILQSRVQALLAHGEAESFQQAARLVEVLENDLGGDRLAVLMLRLEIINDPHNEEFDMGAYGDIVHRMIRTLVLSDSNFKLIMHHIRKLNDKAPSLACNMLDAFLRDRLLREDNEGWVETAVVNRLYISTTQSDGADQYENVLKVLDMVSANIKKPLGLSATHACQTLLWKRVESNCALNAHELAESWCRLALHRIFEESGDLNKAKIARKLLVIALQRHDIADAPGLLSMIPESSKDDQNTQFLIFKLALRTDDTELAVSSLEKVYSNATKDATLLYACILDAQQLGNKELAIKALQMVLEKYEFATPDGVHMPALIRCTIRLIIAQLEAKDPAVQQEATVEQLCRLFDGAATKARKVYKHPQADTSENLWTIQELDWFSKNAYNLALKHASVWSPRHVLNLAQSCLMFISIYPNTLPQGHAEDILLRGIFCNFLAAVLLIALSRVEDNVEDQLQDYLMLRKHVASFDESLQSKIDDLEEAPKQDLMKKLGTLLVYDFEAVIRLKAWDDLKDVVLKAESCESIKVYQQMCDMLLGAQEEMQIPILTAIDIIKRLCNSAWSLTSFPVTTLSRYMRILFRLSLSLPSATVSGVSLALIDQVCGHAEEAKETETPYPDDELEYLATTAFNKAIDYYCIEDDESCKRWAEKAIEVATFLRDGGALAGLMQERLLGLNFDRVDG